MQCETCIGLTWQDMCMQALIKVFVERACSFLSSQMSHLGDAVLASLTKSQHTTALALPDRRHIRQRLRLLRPLMQVGTHLAPPSPFGGLLTAYERLSIMAPSNVYSSSDIPCSIRAHSVQYATVALLLLCVADACQTRRED